MNNNPVDMSTLVSQMGHLSANFISVLSKVAMMIAVFIAVISLCRVAIKFIAIKNSEEKVIAANNLLDIVLGLISIGIIVPIVTWAIYSFLS